MTDAVAIAAIGAVVSLASLAMTLLIKQGQAKQINKQDELHKQINGRMDQLIEAKESAAAAIGKAEGKVEQKEETKAANEKKK